MRQGPCWWLASVLVAVLIALGRVEASQNPLPLPDSASRSKPWAKNILYIISDDLKPVLGSYGVPWASTPNIDRLASRGIRFSRSYTNIAECGPSRGSFLTGYRPSTLHVYSNNDPLRNTMKNVLTVPAVFRFSGFQTWGMGKIGDGRVFGELEFANDPVYPAYEQPTAFNQNATNCFDYPRPYCLASQGWSPSDCKCLVSPGVTSGVIDGDIVPAIERYTFLQPSAYLDERMGDYAAKRLTQLLNSTDPRPFVLFVGFTKPHLPYAAPYTYFDYYDQVNVPAAPWRSPPQKLGNSLALATVDEVDKGYTGITDYTVANQITLRRAQAACVSFVDRQVGKLLAAYDSSTSVRRDETIIILQADHGFHTGELGLFGKWTLFEPATRVPLIIVPPQFPSKDLYSSEWRSQYHAGNVVRTPVELLDVFPTLLDLTGQFDANTVTPASTAIMPSVRGPNSRRLAAKMARSRANVTNAATGRRLQVPMQNGIPFDPTVRQNALATIQGKSLRKYLLGNVSPNMTALVVSCYNRPKFRGYAIRTERYRYVQWFPMAGDVRSMTPSFEELYDYATDPNESTNLVTTLPQIEKQMRQLFTNFMLTNNVEFVRPDSSWLLANEDAAMLQFKPSDPSPTPPLPYLDNWISEVNAFFSPNNLDYTSPFFQVNSAIQTNSAVDPTRSSVGLALRMAIHDLVQALANRNAQQGRRLLQTIPSGFGSLRTMAGQNPNEIVYQVDCPDQSSADFLSNALQVHQQYFTYQLSGFLTGTAADNNEPQANGASSSFRNGAFPSVASVAAASPTLTPTTPSTSGTSSSSPTVTPTIAPTGTPTTSAPTRKGQTYAPSSSPSTSPPTTLVTSSDSPTSTPVTNSSMTPTSTNGNSDDKSGGLSPGGAAGVSIGVIALVSLAGVGLFCFFGAMRRKRELSDPTQHSSDSNPTNANGLKQDDATTVGDDTVFSDSIDPRFQVTEMEKGMQA